MNAQRLASEVVAGPTDLGAAEDPVAALLASYERGGLVSLRTSGTTAHPRRIIRSAASWVESFAPAAVLAELTAASRVFVPGPLSATMNLYAVALAHVVLAERVDQLGAATHAFLTPTALHRLLAQPALPRDRHPHLIVAGDRLGPAASRGAAQRGWRVSHYYGAAQLSFVAWGRDADSLHPFPSVEVRRRAGVLWVRSPWVADREDPPAGLDPVLQRDGDWATVGDRGRVAEDGRVLVEGRGDAVVTAGATVVTAEVEAVLNPSAHGQLAVVGVPHDRLGAIVVAVCTDADDLEPLGALARAALPPADRPRRWLYRPELPLTAAGKIDRAVLARWAGRS